MSLQTFLDISNASNRHQLENLLIKFAQARDFGIISGALVVKEGNAASKRKSFGYTPEKYRAIFEDGSLAERSPVMKRLRTSGLPFSYDQNMYVREGAADLWEAQAEFGYKTGVAMALHIGSQHLLLGFDRSEPLPKDESQMTQLANDLHLLTVYSHVSLLRWLPSLDSRVRTTLSAQELEVLKWTLDGKSCWAIGQIMALSVSTVNFHVRGAVAKLEAVNKHQAAAKAQLLKLI